jgi:hypothetical protein
MSITFGMMDNAYFIGKTEIIKWINETLKMNITRVEQACTGAIYCQLIDCIFPNKVKMNKVNWKAKLETEFLNNLKIMQQALISCKIQKEIDIQRLAKGRYQDNFEILQWFKGIFDNINPDLSNYDPIKRRNNQVLTYLNVNVNQNKINMKGKIPLKIKNNNNVKSLTKDLNLSTINTLSKNIPSSTIRSEPSFCSESNINEENNSLQTEQFMHNSFNKENLMNDGVQTDLNNENIKINDCNEKIEQLNKEIENMNHENEKFEKENQTIKLLLAEVGQEKEFYLNKLKDIEFIIQKAKYNNNIDKNNIINYIEKILFSEFATHVIINENNEIDIKEFVNYE